MYITLHTGSTFLGAMGMLQIVLTLPVALFFYRVVFQVKFFNQLHVLAIYLALGIGADDIFVFVDQWRQSINMYRNTADRLDFTYKRAMKAMGATSATTCVAFLATAVSPIMPIASFGIYAALCIFVNYLFVMTLFPPILMIWHYRRYGCLSRPAACHAEARCCARGCCCFQQPFTPEGAKPVAPLKPAAGLEQDGDGASPAPDDTPAEGRSEGDEEILGRLESFFKFKYDPLLQNKLVAASMVAFFSIYIVLSIVAAFQLEPPTEQEKWFPEDHMYHTSVS
jgi:multidrug efflux pump subunit AcrB